MSRVIVLLLLVFVGTAQAATLRVSLIVGQSNAAGPGKINGTEVEQITNTDYYKPVRKTWYSSRVFNRFDNSYFSKFETPAFTKVQPHKNRRFGVELSLARHLKARPDSDWSADDINVIIKIASGGTSISNMIPTDGTGLHLVIDDYLGSTLETVARVAARYGFDVSYEYLFWLHGETDASVNAANYLGLFQAYLEYLNSEHGLFEPIFAQLYELSEFPGLALINEQMCSVYACTPYNNLPRRDLFHLAGESVITMGLWLGAARPGLN